MSKLIREYIDKMRNWKQFLIEGYATDMKSDIEFLYKLHPELSKIGTQEEYSKYISNILANSQVKQIVYHRTKNNFYQFRKDMINKGAEKRFYFAPFNNNGRYGDTVKMAVLNITNLADPYNDQWLKDILRKHPEYIEGKSKNFYIQASIAKNANSYGYDGVHMFSNNPDEEYSVYEPKQIHILGTIKDRVLFKKFLNK